MPILSWKALPAPPCALPESPRYAHNSWVWLDITGKTLYQHKFCNITEWPQAQAIKAIALPDEIACVLPTPNPAYWLGLGRQGLWQIAIDQPNTPPQHLLQAPYNSNTHRFNDGQADPKGRVWISSLVDDRLTASAALYCIEQTPTPNKTNPTAAFQLNTTERIPGLICGNGLAFGADACSIWWADTRLRTVWRARYDADTACIHSPTVVHQYRHGSERPDGAAISADGHYWLAVLDGHGLDRFDEHGNFVERVPVPLAKPTMPCWGGDNLATLLVCGMGHANNPAINLVACEGLGQGLPAGFAVVTEQV